MSTPGDATPRPARPLRELRAARLLPIRELARAAGVAPLTIQALETGARRPTRRVVQCVAAALGVDLEEVAEFHPRPSMPPSDAAVAEAIGRLEAMGYPHALARRAIGPAPK